MASLAQTVMSSCIEKPPIVHLYNHNMNGVDIADQYCVSYPFTKKTLKVVVEDILLVPGSVHNE